MAHELDAEGALGFVLIVRPAAEPDTGSSGVTAPRDRLHVIELDPAALLAAVPVLAHERALPAVSRPHGALDVGRDVARPGRLAARGLSVAANFSFSSWGIAAFSTQSRTWATLPEGTRWPSSSWA